jgi:hypothetical protein
MCRKKTARDFITAETIEVADDMFQRLYNEQDDIVRTLSTATKSSDIPAFGEVTSVRYL